MFRYICFPNFSTKRIFVHCSTRKKTQFIHST